MKEERKHYIKEQRKDYLYEGGRKEGRKEDIGRKMKKGRNEGAI
jgi:hypothetical protein